MENQWRILAEEVAKLTTLTSLAFCFPNIETLQHFITQSSTWKEMDNCFAFKFSVGFDQQAWYTSIDYDYDVCRCLKYVNGVGNHWVIQAVLVETNAFELIGDKGASSLTDFGSQNTNKLKSSLINNCNEMKTIIGGNGTSAAVLESLEKMFISNCPELESIWESCPFPVGTRSLCQLTTLDLSNCAKLKKIFSRGMIQQLSKLRHLEVKQCQDIEEIVMESENSVSEPGELPSLTTLVLRDLPRLRSIWTARSLKFPPPIAEFKISGCPPGVDLPATVCSSLVQVLRSR